MRTKPIITKWLLWTLVILVIWPLASGTQAKYGGGTGEPNNPYLIYTAEQMNTIGAEPNDWGKHFKLMVDIDLAGYTGTDFNIIGMGGNPFTGVFDGNGHTISNFTYNTSEDRYTFGLFGYIDDPNALISNLGLIDPNVNISTDKSVVGSLTGRLESGIITNCYAADVNIAGERYVGGLVGTNFGLITDCFATGNVTGVSRVGGLVGDNIYYGHITKSYSTGNVKGNYNVGGLVGTNYYDATVTNCSSNCSVDANNHVGGLAGENYSYVANCHSFGNVDAKNQAGGLLGWNDGIVTASCSSAGVRGQDAVGGLVGGNHYHGEIVDCYANGDVLGQSYVGGLIGNNILSPMGRDGSQYYGTVRSCYSTAFVSGDQNIGGLVGSDDGGGVDNDCFWDIEASGQTTSAGGIGKTTAEMQTAGTFLNAGWDFVDETINGTEDIWWILEGQDYPRLWWESISVILVEPHNGDTFEISSQPPLLLAQVHDPKGSVVRVRFDIDIDVAGGGHGHTSVEAQNGPHGWFYEFDWSDRGAAHGSWLIPGEYTITAEATDDYGTVYISPEVRITIL